MRTSHLVSSSSFPRCSGHLFLRHKQVSDGEVRSVKISSCICHFNLRTMFTLFANRWFLPPCSYDVAGNFFLRHQQLSEGLVWSWCNTSPFCCHSVWNLWILWLCFAYFYILPYWLLLIQHVRKQSLFSHLSYFYKLSPTIFNCWQSSLLILPTLHTTGDSGMATRFGKSNFLCVWLF